MQTQNNNSEKTNDQSCLSAVSSSLDLLHGSIWNETPSLIYEDENELFDEGSGYRKIEKMLIPDPPQLNDVLKWHSSKGRDKYSHFEVNNGEGYFSIYDGEETESIAWDLSKPRLLDQSEELISWLAELL